MTRLIHQPDPSLDLVLERIVDGVSTHVVGLQDAVDDVIGPVVNRSVVVRVIRASQKKLKFLDIELAD